MTKAMKTLYRLAPREAEDDAHVLDEMKAPALRAEETEVRHGMEAWVADCLAAIAHKLTARTPDILP